MTDPLRINFSDIQEFDSSLIPAGNYPLMVESYEIGDVMSPGSNAPSNPKKIDWTFVIQPSGDPAKDKFVTRKMWTTTTLYGGGLGRLKNLLKGLGFDTKGELNLNEVLPQTLNKTVLGKTVIRPARGEYAAKSDITGFEPLGGAVNATSANSKTSLLP